MARKVDVGSVLSRTFETYTSQFTLLIPAALVVFVPIAILTGLAFAASPVAGALIGAVLFVLGSVLYQGMVVEAAADMLDGRRDQTIGSLIGGAAAFVVPLLIAGILVGLASVLGLFLLIVGFFLVYTLFAVTAPAIVVERLGAIQGMERSVQLVKDHFLPALGVVVVVLLITSVARFVLELIFGAIDDGGFGSSLGSLVAGVLLAPITALAASILYFDLSGYVGATSGRPGELGGQATQVAPQPGAARPTGGPPPIS
jgi:hypothetical protein